MGLAGILSGVIRYSSASTPELLSPFHVLVIFVVGVSITHHCMSRSELYRYPNLSRACYFFALFPEICLISFLIDEGLFMGSDPAGV